jgi:hypothetical protein
MAVAPNAVMVFTSYVVEDEGIRFHFVCANPGPGQPTDYYVHCTDAEIATVTTQSDLRILLTDKLNRSIRTAGLGPKLDSFIGQSITVA